MNTFLVFAEKHTNRIDAIRHSFKDMDCKSLLYDVCPKRRLLTELESIDNVEKLLQASKTLDWVVCTTPHGPFVAPRIAVDNDVAPALRLLPQEDHIFADPLLLENAVIVLSTTSYEEAQDALRELKTI